MADNIKWFGREFLVKASRVNEDAMNRAGFLLETDIKKSFGTGASNPDVTVRRTKSGKRHRPSAPGSVPNVDDGILRASIIHQTEKKGVDIIGKVGSAISVIKSKTGSDEDYGLFLELGTRFMAARPWLRPALARTGNQILKIFKDANGK